MEKRDLIVIVIAIIIVLIMAMYIKPLVTGQPVKLIPDELAAIFGGGNQTLINNTSFLNESVNGTNLSSMEIPNISANTSENTSVNISIPTPVQTVTWNGTPIDVGLQNGSSGMYIYPREYPVSQNPVYSFSQESTPLISYTKFSGQNSAKTNTFFIPTGYWELWYTVDVNEDLQYPKITEKTESTEKTTEGRKIIEERMDSISVVNPQFSILVSNADTKSEVRFITPSGGLNPRLWKGDFVSPDPPEPEATIREFDREINWDPRPWKEKFYEGYRRYDLDINAQNLISYSIEIKVPDPNSTGKNLSLIQNNTGNQTNPGKLMEDTFSRYIEGVSGNISDPETFEKITSSLSESILSRYSRDDIFREINRMKYAGITITGFKKTDDFYRGPEGSLKVNLAYSTITGERVLPLDIPFIQEMNGWKINDLPVVRI